jgi:hypothetical protein
MPESKRGIFFCLVYAEAEMLDWRSAAQFRTGCNASTREKAGSAVTGIEPVKIAGAAICPRKLRSPPFA